MGFARVGSNPTVVDKFLPNLLSLRVVLVAQWIAHQTSDLGVGCLSPPREFSRYIYICVDTIGTPDLTELRRPALTNCVPTPEVEFASSSPMWPHDKVRKAFISADMGDWSSGMILA